jgi:hypothetical protein
VTTGRRVVITGIASHWGSELARRLEREPSVDFIAGIDTSEPAGDLERTEFIEADIRNPVLARILPVTEADTIVHCGILWYPEPGKSARALHDINVIGTLQLLAAAERTPTLTSLVVRSSAAIYGSEGAAPSFFTEDMARRYPLKTRFQRDIGELEGYFDNFARRHPQISCCLLRYQPEIGPGLDSPLARYLSLPVVPTQLGFDPRLQLLHAEDATGALLATGVTMWLAFQAWVNMAVVASLVPMTGITLPFISYGGSSLCVGLIAVGILVNVGRARSATRMPRAPGRRRDGRSRQPTPRNSGGPARGGPRRPVSLPRWSSRSRG